MIFDFWKVIWRCDYTTLSWINVSGLIVENISVAVSIHSDRHLKHVCMMTWRRDDYMIIQTEKSKPLVSKLNFKFHSIRESKNYFAFARCTGCECNPQNLRLKSFTTTALWASLVLIRRCFKLTVWRIPMYLSSVGQRCNIPNMIWKCSVIFKKITKKCPWKKVYLLLLEFALTKYAFRHHTRQFQVLHLDQYDK